jgi:hypothetical protein
MPNAPELDLHDYWDRGKVSSAAFNTTGHFQAFCMLKNDLPKLTKYVIRYERFPKRK